jgi:hypothetical protein
MRMKFKITRAGHVKAERPGAMADEMIDAMREAAREAVPRIRAGWPKASGKSRDGFRVRERGDKVSVDNPVPYSGHVRRAGGQPTLGRTLVPRVYREEIAEALDANSEEIAAAALGALVRGIPIR